MPIDFHCRECGKTLRVGDGLAGQIGKCSCGARVKVPGPPTVAAPPIEPTTVLVSKAALAAADEAAETRGAWKLAAAAGGVAGFATIVLVAFVVATWPAVEVASASAAGEEFEETVTGANQEPSASPPAAGRKRSEPARAVSGSSVQPARPARRAPVLRHTIDDVRRWLLNPEAQWIITKDRAEADGRWILKGSLRAASAFDSDVLAYGAPRQLESVAVGASIPVNRLEDSDIITIAITSAATLSRFSDWKTEDLSLYLVKTIPAPDKQPVSYRGTTVSVLTVVDSGQLMILATLGPASEDDLPWEEWVAAHPPVGF